MKYRKNKIDYYYVFVTAYLLFMLVIAIFTLKIFDDVRSFTNKSNSMSPSINTGSIIIVKKFNEYKQGDIISYYAKVNNKEEIITHRVLRVGGNVYVTKGDSNEAIDREIVLPRLVIGKVVLIIPYLGYIVSFVKNPFGLWLTIIIPSVLIVIIELSKVFRALE